MNTGTSMDNWYTMEWLAMAYQADARREVDGYRRVDAWLRRNAARRRGVRGVLAEWRRSAAAWAAWVAEHTGRPHGGAPPLHPRAR